MADKIKFRRGLKANLPVLEEGEPAFCTDTKELYIGSSEGNILIGKLESGGGTPVPASNVTNLASSNVTTTGVTLTWVAPSGAVSYDIERNGTFLTNVSGTTYTASGLTSLTTYTFTVKAKYASSTASGVSIQVTTANNGGGGATNLVMKTWVGGIE